MDLAKSKFYRDRSLKRAEDIMMKVKKMRRVIRNIVPLIVISLMLLGCSIQNDFEIKETLDYCVAKTKITASATTDANMFPRTIEKGNIDWSCVDVRDWTSGFWPGVLWYSYEYSGDESLKEHAERFTSPLEIISKSKAIDHDIGFMIYCSYGNGYRITGNPDYKKVMLDAADTLATLYSPSAGTLMSWPHEKKFQHNTIIDNMMNLELLFWAAKNGGDQNLYDIAVSHAENSMRNLVRPDYSIFHVSIYDSINGEFLKGITHQGYSDSSMWARGQGWGIYGFTMCFRETGNQEFLTTADKLANHFLNRLPEDGIPYWDFDDPSIPNTPKDASAAALAASGLLELSTYVTDESTKARYKNAAIELLSKLSTTEYLSGNTNQSFLLHSTGHKPGGSEIDASIIYADYYFIEALLRLKKLEEGEGLHEKFCSKTGTESVLGKM